MPTKKLKQIVDTKVPALILMAKAAGKKTDQEIAVWIIASSVYWRSQGYKKIREEMAK